MLIRYTIADPTGNLTALIESPVATELRREVAAAIMAAEPEVEQLGFLSPAGSGADIALSMAGGEFCGNACLSAAAYFLRQNGLDSGSVRVAMSGADSPVSAKLSKTGVDEYSGSVEMPLPLGAETADSPLGELTLLRFPGICHAILPGNVARAEAEGMIRPLCASMGAEALGLMLLDEASGRLDPLVYVPGADSMFWEHSCASGTSAVGACIALREGRSVCLSLAQPGGSLSVSAQYTNGGIDSLSLGGKVRFQPFRTLEISKKLSDFPV